jgi:hypothetical protein
MPTATRKPEAPKNAVAALPSLDTLETAEASLTELRREPNPYAGITKRADVLDAKLPKRFTGLDEATAKRVKLLIQRDARENDLGLSIETPKQTDGSYHVIFRSKTTKRKVAVTVDQIREWAKAQTPPLPTASKDGGRLPQSTRDAYRKAHDLPVSKAKTAGK